MGLDLARLEQHNDMVERANRLLSEVVTAQDANQVIREAEAARVLARQVKLGEAAVNHAQAVKIRAEIRLADIVEAGQEAGEIATRHDGGRPVAMRADAAHIATPKQTFSDLGINRFRLREARELRQLAPTPAEAEQRVMEEAERATSQKRELSRSGLLQMIREKRTATQSEHRQDVQEMRDFAKSITPDDYDPGEDRHSSAVQRAILAALEGIKHLDQYDADDVRRALDHSNPRVRDIVKPAYTQHLIHIIEVVDRFRELLP